MLVQGWSAATTLGSGQQDCTNAESVKTARIRESHNPFRVGPKYEISTQGWSAATTLGSAQEACTNAESVKTARIRESHNPFRVGPKYEISTRGCRRLQPWAEISERFQRYSMHISDSNAHRRLRLRTST